MALLERLVTVIVLFSVRMHLSEGHGRLIEPASRNAMWRFKYPNPRNYNDMGLNCGGFPNQFEKNGGRCGVCGDPYQGPRRHEAGGKYARGVIARQYRMASLINVTVTLTSNHMGYFEFRICPVNNPRIRATQACLDKYPMNIIGHGSRYYIRDRQSRIDIEMLVMLPPRMKCTQCVLQWKYVAGQSMGPDGRGGECLGCGNQENFVNCADIAIGNHAVTPIPTTPAPAGPTQPMVVAAPQMNQAAVYSPYGSNGANSITGKVATVADTKPWYQNQNAAHNHMMVPARPVPTSKPWNSWQNNNVNPSMQNMNSFMMENYQWITDAPPTGQMADYGHSNNQNENSLSEQQQEHLNEMKEAQESGEMPKSSPPQWGQNSLPNQYTNNQDPSYMKGYNDAMRAIQTKLGISGHGLIANRIQETRKHTAPTRGTSTCAEPVCKGINSAAGNVDFDSWCTVSCRNSGHCPANMCSCTCPGSAPWTSRKVCRGLDRSKGEAMDSWCQINCKGNHCPPNLCICS